jgi:hypothetical protein
MVHELCVTLVSVLMAVLAVGAVGASVECFALPAVEERD